jgi:sialate O-acetylesterase
MLRLHSLLTDHAVLQRDEPIIIRGTASPGASVQVTFDGESADASADDAGDWSLQLAARPAGGPFRLTARSGEETLVREDLQVGEVWFCSGQSNMEWSIEQTDAGEAEIFGARFPELRLFYVPKMVSLTPNSDFGVGWALAWQTCTPQTARVFSSVAYHFARRLLPELGCAIGLIGSAWGGTAALPWTPREAIEEDQVLGEHLKAVDEIEVLTQPFAQDRIIDTGNEGEPLGWAAPDFAASDWETMALPCFWQSTGLNINGAVWFRREIEIPESWSGKALSLNLGVVDDFDTSYFNGQPVGAIGPENASAWRTHRCYQVPAELVKPGRNVIAVRVFDAAGDGGMPGPDFRMHVAPETEPQLAMSLTGDWQYKVERAVPKPAPGTIEGQNLPTTLFNAMVAPCTGFPVRGFLWYQGESDVCRANIYGHILTTMIHGWREAWGGKERPFYLVQLANYGMDGPEKNDDWAALREAQAEVATSVPACDYCVILDCGDPYDIHPMDKRTVGHRLARIALANIYEKSVPFSGPRFLRHQVEGNQVRLFFTHASVGLRSRDKGPIRGFEIAGADGVYHAADVTVESESLLVHAPEVSEPTEVRYSWTAAPVGNLENGYGLPAGPFRSRTTA